jgi:hypothetical protein
MSQAPERCDSHVDEYRRIAYIKSPEMYNKLYEIAELSG